MRMSRVLYECSCIFFENQTVREGDQNKLQPLPDDIHPNID